MAEIEVVKHKADMEDSHSEVSVSEVSDINNNNGEKKKGKKRRSRYDVLDEKWSSQLNNMDSKFEMLLTEIRSSKTSSHRRSRSPSHRRSRSPSHRRSSKSPSHKRSSTLSHRQSSTSPSHRRSSTSPSHRRSVSPSHRQRSMSPRDRERSFSPPVRRKRDKFVTIDSGSESDVLSLFGSASNLGSEDDKPNSDSENISSQKKLPLFNVFGADATVKKTKKQEGMSLDQSQKEVLESSYRCKVPGSVTAFSEDTIDMFPVDEESKNFLEVPSFDPLVESCLIKRHGQKASFAKSKSKSLVTQPCKVVENLAYRGQQAARMGIIVNAYVQQGLADLMSTLQEDDFDKSKAVQEVKDVFAMSTKCLDQIGRTGAFHHIIRRSVTMTDTGLYELNDASKFKDLPLTGDGLFGQDLEPLIKTRKEIKKQMEDLVPEVSRKRKFTPKPNHETSSKRPRVETQRRRFDNEYTPREEHSFQAPRPPLPRDFQRGRRNQQPPSRGRNLSFPSRSFNSRRGMGRSDAQ